MTNKIAVFCTEGLVLDALLEHWQESEVLSAYSPVLVSEGLVGETVLFKQRPIAFQNLDSLDGENFSSVMVLETGSLQSVWLQQLTCPVVWACPSEQVPKNIKDLHQVASAEVLVLQMLLGQHECYVTGTVLLPASTHGKQGVEALASQTVSLLSAQPIKRSIFGRQLSFNAYPLDFQQYQQHIRQQIGDFSAHCQVSLSPIQVSVFHGMAMQLSIDFASETIASLQLENWKKESLFSLDQALAEVSIYQASQLEGIVQIANLHQPECSRQQVSLWLSFDDIQIFVKQGLISAAEILLKHEL